MLLPLFVSLLEFFPVNVYRMMLVVSMVWLQTLQERLPSDWFSILFLGKFGLVVKFRRPDVKIFDRSVVVV